MQGTLGVRGTEEQQAYMKIGTNNIKKEDECRTEEIKCNTKKKPTKSKKKKMDLWLKKTKNFLGNGLMGVFHRRAFPCSLRTTGGLTS
jgi:hypothetical protein